MGIPQHYSRDIVQRCQTLIRGLGPVAKNGGVDDSQLGGPLGTTFLLAMATPMIVLPIERLFKPAGRAAVVGDDRHLDPALTEVVDEVLGPERRFADSPFWQGGWSYVSEYHFFNIAGHWPPALLERLSEKLAFRDAGEALTRCVLLDLRNALAHGAITYLDADGYSTEGEAAMLAFAGKKMKQDGVAGLNVLRASEEDFLAFLMAWADWIAQPCVLQVLADQDPMAA